MSTTVACLIIGNEILSGRTQEKNAQQLAQQLGQRGLELVETRIIKDCSNAIIRQIQELAGKYDYVFTSGGIGPTHDDITSAAIAEAFNRALIVHQPTYSALATKFSKDNKPFTPARKKMAMLPQGATPIANRISVAPGFRISNVFVLAGVPSIFTTMLQECINALPLVQPIQNLEIPVHLGEGELAKPLAELAEQYPDVAIGSYPVDQGNFSPNPDRDSTSSQLADTPLVNVVLRHYDAQLLTQIAQQLKNLLPTKS